MADVRIGSFGTWSSPITPDLVAMESVSLGDPRVDGDNIYWTEGRPSEGGRTVIVMRSSDGAMCDVTPIDFDVRSRVHEYGGGAYQVDNGLVYFVNLSDQQIYGHNLGDRPLKLTNNNTCRYADIQVDRRRKRLVAVREDHPPSGGEAINTLVAIDVGTGVETVLHGGYDFYSSPVISPDGTKLAWLCWRHPYMPWISTHLMTAAYDEKGGLSYAQVVAGGNAESIFQPQWSPNNELYFISDRTDFWNIYRMGKDGPEAILKKEAEFGVPQWQFGLSTYAFLGETSLVCAFATNGAWRLANIDFNAGVYNEHPVVFSSLSGIRSAKSRVVARSSAAADAPSINLIDPSGWVVTPLKFSIPPDKYAKLKHYFSRPQPIQFPTDDNETAHAFYYPPINPDWNAPSTDRPPLLVRSHGGPTAAANSGLDLTVQFWTSRGFGVVDVNYRGSTGYGRKYREKLYGKWGVIDVSDCIAGAKFLAAKDEVDQSKVGIKGGSAGGFTALCALTFQSFFNIGAIYYGISDLVALAIETHKFESHYTDWLIEPYRPRSILYHDRSPINFVDKLSVPVSFFHGEEDRVVPVDQANKMYAALRGRGISSALLVFQGEQHGFRRSEHIRCSLEAELLFYVMNLIGAPLYS